MRSKRAAEPAKNNNNNNKPNSRELVYEPMKFSNVDDYDSNKGRRKNAKTNGKKQSKNEDSNALKEPVLDRLVKDIRQKVKEFKKFWSNLPYQACNNDEMMSAPPSSSANCWNGHAVDK
jgi:glypican 4